MCKHCCGPSRTINNNQRGEKTGSFPLERWATKTTACTRRTAARETRISRHHGSPIEGPPETYRITAQWNRGLKGHSQSGTHYAESLKRLIAEVIFAARLERIPSSTLSLPTTANNFICGCCICGSLAFDSTFIRQTLGYSGKKIRDSRSREFDK